MNRGQADERRAGAGSRSWHQDIDQANQEINVSSTPVRASSAGIELPRWSPYALSAVLLALVAWHYPDIQTPHNIGADRDFSTGPHVALLVIAEDVERYRQSEGQLPEELPGVIGQLVDVNYEKLGDNRFRLRMPTPSGELVFDDEMQHVRLHAR